MGNVHPVVEVWRALRLEVGVPALPDDRGGLGGDVDHRIPAGLVSHLCRTIAILPACGKGGHGAAALTADITTLECWPGGVAGFAPGVWHAALEAFVWHGKAASASSLRSVVLVSSESVALMVQ